MTTSVDLNAAMLSMVCWLIPYLVALCHLVIRKESWGYFASLIQPVLSRVCHGQKAASNSSYESRFITVLQVLHSEFMLSALARFS